VAQQTGRQYDDDLTVGADEYDESFSTGYVDLFEPLGDDDAPIAKLKTIVLSIDWEITDDILQQLHDELLDLKDIWAGNKINLIYLQALEKLGRYISTEKSHSHPNAIKLLLAFYYNLEKIVSSSSMSEEEKKHLLLQDVKKFDQFKLQIAPGAQEKKKAGESPVAASSPVVAAVSKPLSPLQGKADVLTNLKAIVLSIDWEISDKELARLSEEVSKLEKIFSDSRAKLIFLQGVGALGNYIRLTKSNAHPDAFKLFHSFYAGLEKICHENLTSEQEKKILLVEVGKFNAFKALISTISSAVVVPSDDASSAVDEDFTEEEVEDEEGPAGGFITPAFADVPGNIHGFREDVAVTGEIDNRVASFLGVDEGEGLGQRAVVAPALEEAPEYQEVTSSLDALFGEDEEAEPSVETADVALSGVDVETDADDDSDEKALPLQAGVLAPALIEANGQSLYAEPPPAPESSKPSFEVTAVIPGVDVETEADDDSDEAALPLEQGSVAPALAFSDEKYGFRETDLVAGADEDVSDLEDRLHSFFGEEIEEASQGKGLSLSDDTGDTEGVLSIEAIQEEPVLHDIQEDEQVAVIEDEESSLVSLSEFLEATSADDTEKESAVSLAEETWAFDKDAKEVEPEVVAAAVEDQEWGDVPELTEDSNVEVAEETATEESWPEVATSTDDAEKENAVSLVEETWAFDEDEKKVEPVVVTAAVEEPVSGNVPELTEDWNIEVAEETATEESGQEVVLESIIETAEGVEVEPFEAAVFVAEREADASAAGMDETLEVVFESVGDDVEVDELPCAIGSAVGGGDIIRESDSSLGLQECVSSILLKEYDVAFPDFHAKIDGLRQWWHGQYVNTTILQLMLTVGQYIDTYRAEADPEAFTLLKSLGDTLAKICTMKAGFDMGCQQMLAEEVTKVLLWQQGLIATLTAKQERGDSFSGVVGGPAGLFSGE
jgi:pilus assembly protein FimV